jgi:predicted 2-oxoglutarate/Fe(II)-dependent dioxygenase YbiX
VLPPFSFRLQDTDSGRYIVKDIYNITKVTSEQGIKVIFQSTKSHIISIQREREREISHSAIWIIDPIIEGNNVVFIVWHTLVTIWE